MDNVERLFKHKNFKCFYTVPRFHSLLGVSFIRLQKKAIVQLTAKYGVYFVKVSFKWTLLSGVLALLWLRFLGGFLL
ncbi:hypothetical protein JCM16418A_40300 [Paenibacillus pini]